MSETIEVKADQGILCFDGAARRLELSFEAGDVPDMGRLVQAMLEAGLREEA